MKKVNKTLVIHPKDPRTFFMSSIYLNKPNYDVFNDVTYSREKIIELLSNYKRIILLGAGDFKGMYDGTRECYLIDADLYPYLKDKEVISIWNYSDQFMRKGWIKGFHTGVLIYELEDEKGLLQIKDYDQATLYSNISNLCNLISECIDLDPKEIKKYLLKHYVGDDEITQFNRERLRYYKDLYFNPHVGKSEEEIEESEDRRKKARELLKKQEEEAFKERTREFYNLEIYLENEEVSCYLFATLNKDDLFPNCKYLDFYCNKNFYLKITYLNVPSPIFKIKDDVKSAINEALTFFAENI